MKVSMCQILLIGESKRYGLGAVRNLPNYRCHKIHSMKHKRCNIKHQEMYSKPGNNEMSQRTAFKFKNHHFSQRVELNMIYIKK